MFPFKRKIVLPGEAEVKAGDIIGFSGRSWVSAAINIGTYGLPLWGVSHVGILANCPDGKLRLFESTTLDGEIPCEITGKPICGTQAHALDFILGRYRGKAYHYPLYRPLHANEDEGLTEFLIDTIGVPYDAMGAFRSAGVGLSWIESLLREQNLSSIFCSEWVAAAYAVTGLHPTDNVSRWNPNRLCRHLRGHNILCKPRRLIFRWQGRLNTAELWRQTNGNGEWPDDLAAKFDRAGVRYAYVENGDVRFLEWACRTRRGCGITVMGGAHMVALVHLDAKWAALLDNNNVSKFTWFPRESLIAEWKASYGWAVTPIHTPAAPLPQ